MACPIVSNTNHTEGRTLKQKAGTRGTCSAKFWSYIEHPMDHGLNGHCPKGLCLGDRPTKYHPISKILRQKIIIYCPHS